MTLEELMEIEMATVYGVSKFFQKVTEAPASVSVITAEEIRRFGWRTLAEILRSIAGVFVTNDRNYRYLGVRGFGRPGDYNSRVLLLIDGQRVNDNLYDSLLLGTEFILDIDLIDRIEFSRGPGSSLYGSNAFLGTVHVFTRQGSDVRGIEASIAVGSLETYQFRLSAGNRLLGGMEALLSASFFDQQGNRRLYYAEYDDPATHFGIAEGVDQDRFGSLFASFSFEDFQFQGAWNERKKTVPTGAYGTDFNHPGNSSRDGRSYLNLKYRRGFSNGVELNARLSYDRYRYQGDYLYSGRINRDASRGEWWGIESRLSGTFRERQHWIVGWEYTDHFRQEQKNYDEEPRQVLLDDQRSGRNWAGYFQDEIHLGNSWILNAGVRYDHDESFGGSWNPRLALIYRLRPGTSLKLLYGTAFRVPNVFERYYHDQGNTSKPNPALKPEKIATYEGVWEQYLGKHFRGQVSLYYYRIHDLISQTLDPADGLLVYQNIDRTEAKGWEVEAEWRGPKGMTVKGAYAYQLAENPITQEELTNSPRHLARLGFNLPIWRQRIFFSPEMYVMGRRRTLAGKNNDGYVTLNAALLAQEVFPRLDVSAGVYNLTDQSYGDPGAVEHRQDIIGQDGRTFRLKITYRF